HTRLQGDWSSDVCSSDLARFDAVADRQRARRIGQHDAGPVIVGKDQRALMRAGRDDDPLRPHLPEARARQVRIGIGEMVGDALRSEERRVGKEWRTGWWT